MSASAVPHWGKETEGRNRLNLFSGNLFLLMTLPPQLKGTGCSPREHVLIKMKIFKFLFGKTNWIHNLWISVRLLFAAPAISFGDLLWFSCLVMNTNIRLKCVVKRYWRNRWSNFFFRRQGRGVGEANRDQILMCVLFVCCCWVLFVGSVFLSLFSLFISCWCYWLLFVAIFNFQLTTSTKQNPWSI